MTASTAPSRPVQQQHNHLGRSALVLGVAGILLGVFAGITWFVVVPLGLLTLIFGVFGVSEKRHYVGSDATTAIIGTIAGAVTLALGVWGTGTFLSSLHRLAGDPDTGAAVPATMTGQSWAVGSVTMTWGQPHTFGNGVIVAVSAPVLFTPAGGSAGARSVVLSVTVTNCGRSGYRPDGAALDPTATFDGRPLSQVADPDGDVSLPVPATIQAGQSVGYRVAYALPRQTGELKLAFRPDPDAAQAVVGGRT